MSLSDSDLKRYLSESKSGEIGVAPPCGVTVAELLDSDLPATATKASAKPSVQGKSGDQGVQVQARQGRGRGQDRFGQARQDHRHGGQSRLIKSRLTSKPTES